MDSHLLPPPSFKMLLQVSPGENVGPFGLGSPVDVRSSIYSIVVLQDYGALCFNNLIGSICKSI